MHLLRTWQGFYYLCPCLSVHNIYWTYYPKHEKDIINQFSNKGGGVFLEYKNIKKINSSSMNA